jgi:hypothetical protein
MMFKEIIAISSDNHVKLVNTPCRQNVSCRLIKASDAKSNKYISKAYLRVFFVFRSYI